MEHNGMRMTQMTQIVMIWSLRSYDSSLRSFFTTDSSDYHRLFRFAHKIIQSITEIFVLCPEFPEFLSANEVGKALRL